MFRFMIWISPNLKDKSKHASVDRVLDDAFKFAVNINPRRIALEAVPHLRIKLEYKSINRRTWRTYGCSCKSYSVVRYHFTEIIWKGACQCILAGIKKINTDVTETRMC